MSVLSESISIKVADGTVMNAYIARPDSNKQVPAVLVFQEAFGVNEYMKDITRRIAAEGYLAITPELYHRTTPGFTCSYTDIKAAMPQMQALTIDGLKADIQASYDYMKALDVVMEQKMASIGFCLGGRVSFLASTFLPLKAAACFYGGGINDEILKDVSNINMPLLLCWGGQDNHLKKEYISHITETLAEHDKDYVNVIFSKAGHGFFCDARESYHPDAAAEAWELVKTFWDINMNN